MRMPSQRRRGVRVLTIFALTVAVLAVTEWTGAELTWREGRWRPPVVLGWAPSDSLTVDGERGSEPALPPVEAALATTGDTSAAGSLVDSLARSPFRMADSAVGWLSAPPGSLDNFFAELTLLQPGTGELVRIAHFGDSQIEGDRITMDLREGFRERFGDPGVGWVPITSEVAALRMTVRHTFSGGWAQRSSPGPEPFAYGMGPAGLAWAPSRETARVEYRMGVPFAAVAVGIGPSDDSTQLRAVFDSGTVLTTLPPRTVDTVVILQPPNDSARTVQLEVDGGAAVYGAWLNRSQGVAVDNFSLRGATGLHLASVRACAASRTPGLGRTRLVILQYGLNLMTDRRDSYQWYADRLEAGIDRLRRCFPGASVLIVGPSLRGIRTSQGVREVEGVRALTAAMRALAEREGAAFWDLAAAMRAQRDMSGWSTTGLAPDLAHFSASTARTLARLLVRDLLSAYDEWQVPGDLPALTPTGVSPPG